MRTLSFIIVLVLYFGRACSISAQQPEGDVGNAALFVLNPRLQVNFSRHLLFDLYSSYYYRRTYYRDHPNISVHTFEVRAGLTYEL